MKSYEKALLAKKKFIRNKDNVNLKRLENQVKWVLKEIKEEDISEDNKLKRQEYIEGFEKVLNYKGEES